MGLSDWLPQPPWLGPPLPIFLNILWPWVQGGEQSSLQLFPSSSKYVTTSEESSKPSPTPSVIYENTEDLTVVRGENGRIEKITRKITVTKNE